LAEPNRLAIVLQLAESGSVCACDFTACCSVGQPTISHHLKVLREAGLIRGQRHGQWIWYELDPEGLKLISGLVGELASAALNPRSAEPIAAGR
jgi:ArsR family transcriptional regulator